MRVTITAKGYEGLKTEVAEVTETGAYVIVNRPAIDLAPRKIYFNDDAIKDSDRTVDPMRVRVRRHECGTWIKGTEEDTMSMEVDLFKTEAEAEAGKAAEAPSTQVVTIKGERKSWTVEIPVEPISTIANETIHWVDDNTRIPVMHTRNTFVSEILVGTIAGAKSHRLSHVVDQRVITDMDGNELSNQYGEYFYPCCGTTRNAKNGWKYENAYRLTTEITCGKCKPAEK